MLTILFFISSVFHTPTEIQPEVKLLLAKISIANQQAKEYHIKTITYVFDEGGHKSEGVITERACKPGYLFSSSGDIVTIENKSLKIHINTYTQSIVVKKSSGKLSNNKGVPQFVPKASDSLMGKNLVSARISGLNNGHSLIKLGYKNTSIKNLDIEVDQNNTFCSITSFITGMDGKIRKERVEYEKNQLKNIEEKVFSHEKYFSEKGKELVLKPEFKDYTLYDKR